MQASHAFRISSAAAILLAASSASALAATASGTAIAVIQATDIVGATGKHVLEPEAPIFMGDRVNTDTIGEAQIKFRDNTRIVVGPNSSLLIDKFVFSDETTARSVTINAVRGTFRFITGTSPKNAYVIRTPTATIGLRGTHFDFSVGALGETRLALYGGGVRFCDLQRNCVELTGRCDVVIANPGEGIRRVRSDFEKAGLIDASFPYLRSQRRLNADFRVDTGACAATQATHAGLVPAGAPPVADCPPAKDYGHHGKHGRHGKGKGGWGGHHGKGKGGWGGHRGGEQARNGIGHRGGHTGKGHDGKSHGKGGEARGHGVSGYGVNGNGARSFGWTGGIGGFAGGKGTRGR